jgi:hypothetical protein
MAAIASRRTRLGVRRLTGLASYYTSLFGPLVARPERTGEAIGAIAAALMNDSMRWNVIHMQPLARESEAYEYLVQALRAAGFLTQEYFCFGNWYLRTNGRAFDQYFSTLPSRLRNTLRRKRKQAAGLMRIEITTDAREIDRALSAYEAIYASSWKVAESHPDFIRNLIRICAENGWLRLGVLYMNDQPAAAQLWIVMNRTASIYKLAYDERFSDYSVGSILSAELMRYAIDVDKVEEVDYLSGDDAYKRDWMECRRERWGVVAFNPGTFGGLAAAARHIGGHAIKQTAVGARTRLNSLIQRRS